MWLVKNLYMYLQYSYHTICRWLLFWLIWLRLLHYSKSLVKREMSKSNFILTLMIFNLFHSCKTHIFNRHLHSIGAVKIDLAIPQLDRCQGSFCPWWSLTYSSHTKLLSFTDPVGTRWFKTRIGPLYPRVCRKCDWNGVVSQNNRKKGSPVSVLGRAR